MDGDEVTKVTGALAIEGFVGQDENFKLDPVLDWEPMKFGKYRGFVG